MNPKVTNLANDNKIIEGEGVTFAPEDIIFEESTRNNVLFLEGNLKITGKIRFRGSNSVIFLRSNINVYKLNVDIFNNSAFYMGANNYMDGKMWLILSEQKNIFFGNNGTFSHGIWIRTADPHLIYSIKTMERKNFSKSIFIGDHVWIGQSAIILKGTQIGSGSIIGAGSVVAGKKITSNTAWAGNPARKVSKGVFWNGLVVNNWTEKQTEEFLKAKDDDFIFKPEPEIYIPFDEIDRQLAQHETPMKKLEYLVNISNIEAKNRFAF